ncbi:MAG: putative OB-fold protein [Myxococcota bacterium]
MAGGIAHFTAPFELAYDYKRSLGPVLSGFFTALRSGRILGATAADGRVIVPPSEYDPLTGVATTGLVEVGQDGTVASWTWITNPRPTHPLPHPFALALITLSGADTAMLHAVDAGSPEAMSVGMTVRAAWRPVRTGSIRDIACFVPPSHADFTAPRPDPVEGEPLTRVKIPSRLAYTITASPTLSIFLTALLDRRILGWRCPTSGRVYVPPRGASPTSGEKMEEIVELSQKGTVTTYCVVNIPFEGQRLTPPYVCAHIVLDGADVPLLHLVGGCGPEEVRMGMRVEAVWDDTPAPTLESVRYFAPIDEPDATVAELEEAQR